MARQRIPANARVEFDDEEETETPPVVAQAAPPSRQAIPQGARVEFDDEPPPKPGEKKEKGFLDQVRESPVGQFVQEADKATGRFVRSLTQTVVPWSDEITAGASVVEQKIKGDERPAGEIYRSRREEERKADAEAAAHPITHYPAVAAGMLVPGLGAARATTTTGRVALGAAEGAFQASGASEAELTGDDPEIGKFVAHTGAGAAAGGALTYGLDRLATGARTADDKALLTEVLQRVPKSIRDKVADNDEAVLKILRDNGLDQHASNPEKFREEATKLADRLGKEIVDVKTAADQAGQAARTVKAESVLDRLEAVKGQQKTPQNIAKVQRIIDTVKERWVPERPMDDRQLLQALSAGGKGNTKTKLAVRKDPALVVAKKFGLDKAVRDPIASKEATDQAVDVVGTRLGEAYDVVDGVPGLDDTLRGIDVNDIVRPLNDLAKEYAKLPTKQAEAGKVRGLIENIRKTWGGEKGPQGTLGADVSDMPLEPKKVLARDLRKAVSDVQELGFGGDTLDPKAAQKLQREIAGKLKNTLDKYLDEKGALEGINELNAEFAILKDLQKAATKRAADAELKPVPPPPAQKDGNMTVGEVRELADEVGGQARKPPKIASALDAIETGKPKRQLPTKIADELESLANKDIDADDAAYIRGLEAKKELVDTLAKGGIYRDRLTPFEPTGLRDISSKVVDDLTRKAAVAGVALGKPEAAAGLLVKPTGQGLSRLKAAFQRDLAALAREGNAPAAGSLSRLYRLVTKGEAKPDDIIEAVRSGVPTGIIRSMSLALSGRDPEDYE